jgi:hypothetical protein
VELRRRIEDEGEVETVYNLEVEGDHTYFVGARDWGFSVWAHNACFNPNGRNGSADHQADVAANNNQATGELKPRAVSGRVPDGVGRVGQVVTIRGQVIDPGRKGRIIVESEPIRGGRPVSEGRRQIRDIRAADPNATIVVTDPENPLAPPLVYPPGTQPPPVVG